MGCDCDRYIEIWNNVFTQFYNDGHDNYTELSQKNIDTGMGLERLAVVCQGVDSLFDVDTVMNITNKVSEITGAKYGQSHEKDVSLRVITDHIRSATFMIGDGVLPSNEGRGYVLRRLLRRAARHGKLLGVNEPFLYKVCDMVVHENKGAYPDLVAKQDYITRVIKLEEENFSRTIDGGMNKVSELIAACKESGGSVISGADAFRLYDTYGFPLDLTKDMVEEQGLTVDEQGFSDLMEQQRERARAARGDMSEAWQGLDLGLDNTPTAFTGYETLNDTGKILAIVSDGELTSTLLEGAEGLIVLDRTPFYAEMGGQAADHGVFRKDGAVFRVSDVQKDKAGKYLHHGSVESGEFSVDDTVSAEVCADRRHAIMRAHSATHLLQAALRQVLGDHVQQAGSLVEPDHLRFDFTHFSAMTPEEIDRVQEIVNDNILEGVPVVTEVLPIEEARRKGATALFGEKYGDTVRVVEMGDVSMEFCGGTHLDNTAKAGAFCIISESSIASGVRRIEAFTGKESLKLAARRRTMLGRVADIMKTTPRELTHRAENFTNELRELRQNLSRMKDRLFSGEVDRSLFTAANVKGAKVVTAVRTDIDANDLRKLGDFIKERDPDSVAVLASVADDKITLLAVCGANSVARGMHAGKLVKEVSAACGGSGGGKPDSAMGGAKDASKLDAALASVEKYVADNIKD